MSIATDLRYAVRQNRRRPGFAAIVILTLALGIGANAAVFSVVDAVLLRPLPYRDPDRLTFVYSQFPTMGFDKFWMSLPEYLEYRRWNGSMTEVGAYRVTSRNVAGGKGEPQRVRAAIATASLFRVLGVDPIAGRTFTDEEDLVEAAPAVVLGEDLWRRAFGGDRDLVGKTVLIDGRPTTLVGVMPRGFDVDDSGVEVWIPPAIEPDDLTRRASHFLYGIGRLRDDVPLAAARQEIAGLIERWQRDLPDTHTPRPETHEIRLDPLKDQLVGQARPAMLLLAGAVGLVLLIACANVANLLLARAETRQREVSIRTALGASPGRLVRQFFTESILLAFAGGVVGVGCALVGVNAILAANPHSVVRVERVGLDLRVLGFTLVLALVTGVVFGLAPALHARARALVAGLREGGRTTSGRGRNLFRAGLVVAEVALAAVLVIGAGLLIKSFKGLTRVDPGFDPRGMLTLQLSLPDAVYPEAKDVQGFYDRLLTEVRALPGVQAAALMTGLPPVRDVNANDTEFDDSVPKDDGGDGPPHNVDYYQTVSLGYFEAMSIPIVAGRPFTPPDAGGPPVAIVNKTLARVFWPEGNPIGRRLRPCCGDEIPWFTIVGIARDVKQGGLDQPTGTELYFLADQSAKAGFAARSRNLVVRAAAGSGLALAAPVGSQIRRLDPGLPIGQVQPMTEVLAGSISAPRFLTLLVGIFAVVALTLAAVGTYGVLSYAVEQRRHEMGVRMALGARTGLLMRMVLGQGMRLAVGGLALGLAGAWALRRLIASVLFEVKPGDPPTFAGVAALLATVALAACVVPAFRATRVDPVVSLRAE